MAIINEGVDASISAYATGNYNVLEGDVFNGAIGGGDTQDGVNFQGMTIGQEYTVTVTVDDVSDTTALTPPTFTPSITISPMARRPRLRLTPAGFVILS